MPLHPDDAKAVCFGVLVVAAYGIAKVSDPSLDGYAFTGVITMLAAIGGFVVRGQISLPAKPEK